MRYFLTIAILAIASIAYADSATTVDMGDIKIHTMSDGTTGTTVDMGDIQFHRFSDGTRITTIDMGDGFKQHNINEGVGDNLFQDYTAPEPSGDGTKYLPLFDD